MSFYRENFNAYINSTSVSFDSGLVHTHIFFLFLKARISNRIEDIKMVAVDVCWVMVFLALRSQIM